jgi:hypothetical protein
VLVLFIHRDIYRCGYCTRGVRTGMWGRAGLFFFYFSSFHWQFWISTNREYILVLGAVCAPGAGRCIYRYVYIHVPVPVGTGMCVGLVRGHIYIYI